MQRSAKKCEDNQKAQKAKMLKAMKEKNMQSAKIYGDSCIREKNQALQFQRFAAKIDAVASRLESAMRVQEINAAMGSTVRSMAGVLKNMNVDHVAATMEDFEKAFADMDVRTGYMEGAMETSTGMMTSPDEVDQLMQMAAEEANLDVAALMDSAGTVGTKKPAAAAAATTEDALEARLAQLRR
jgi:charged multivesicular body protein 1